MQFTLELVPFIKNGDFEKYFTEKLLISSDI
jgi:hypothetical protein